MAALEAEFVAKLQHFSAADSRTGRCCEALVSAYNTLAMRMVGAPLRTAPRCLWEACSAASGNGLGSFLHSLFGTDTGSAAKRWWRPWEPRRQ